MAKDKERTVNPAQQARKQEKNRAIKKSKNEQQARRNEQLARRNPDRIQRQIDDLKALESTGEIKPREKAILADLERDLRAIRKAREALGEKAPTFGNARPPRSDQAGRNDGGVLGKRGRDGERRHDPQARDDHSDSGNETDESVRNIPMPRDTPPPVPREFRRNNNNNNQQQQRYHQHNMDENNDNQPALRPHIVPEVAPKTTYSSAPQIRNLQKEATTRFVPSVVKRKQDAVKGVSGELLEPEDMDRLEAAGYYGGAQGLAGSEDQQPVVSNTKKAVGNDAEAQRLAEEVARFEQELAAAGDMDVDEDQGDQGTTISERPRSHRVEIEEVEDEDL